MSRHIKCEGCGFEEVLRPEPSVRVARYDDGEGNVLEAELCAKCRHDIVKIFPRLDELDVPTFLQPTPEETVAEEDALAREYGWDGEDRSDIS